MAEQHPFKWRHFEAEIILVYVRWYLRYALSYRDLEELMLERGVQVDHTTIYRWVQRYAPELEKRCRPHLKGATDSWRVDETYVKIKGVWMYLYRAVDSQGNTLEFLLSVTRDAQAAKRFFTKALAASHTVTSLCNTARFFQFSRFLFCHALSLPVLSSGPQMSIPIFQASRCADVLDQAEIFSRL